MKYEFKVRPYPHQVEALKHLITNRGGALFMPMRSGKTKVAVDFASACHMKWGIKRVLVVAPLSVIGVWHAQIRMNQPAGIELEWRIINYERLYSRAKDEHTDRAWVPIRNKELVDFDADLIIADESHKIGDPTTLQSKKLVELGKEARFKVILTGTPMHRKPFAIFGQFKFLDEGVFGSNWTHFKNDYGLWGGYGGYVLMRYRNLKRMRRKIKPYVFVMRDVPPRAPVHEVVPVYLNGSRPIYDEMARESMAELDGGVSVAPIVLTRILRLAQICGGHLRVEEGYKRAGREKLDTFFGLMEQMRDGDVKKVVVFCRFLREMKDARLVCRKLGYDPLMLHGKVPAHKREERIAAFEEGDEPMAFISQVSTGALGIDLSSATVAVFYSLTESLVDFDQASARIRKFKEVRPLTYYYLLARGTVDEAMYMALKSKRDIAELVLSHPELLQRDVTL